MKYEMIFGDEKLFDGAPEMATHATKGGGFYGVSDGMVEYISDGIFNGMKISSVSGYLIAERRIIKEPKRWTLEDKKAGRLPEVSAQCKDRSFLFKVINVTDKYVVIETMQSGDVYSLPHHSFMSSCEPIETPDEKAQREEDEFVKLMIDLASQEQLLSSGFKNGVTAAYRKLKGGE